MDKLSKKALKDQYKSREIIGGVYCIRCSANNAVWLKSTTDMQGSRNRYAFSISTNTSPEIYIAEAWAMYGPSAFSFEILEEIKKKETQSTKEFSDDIATLLELWTEKTES